MLGKNIRKARKEKGMTQLKLAEKTGLNRSYINLVENGKKVPTIGTLMDISIVLETTASELLREEV